MNDSNNMELNPVSNQRSNMDQEEKVLKNECVNLKDEVNRIVSRYSSSISGCPAINAQLKKIVNRSKEYEGGTYIVLVVGPVKSGKSTLVNLIAHAYVSPTHFLECTVRPSIISKRHGEDNKITVYTSEETKDRIEQIDTIVDCIRGIEGEDSLVNIKKSVFDLTCENIEDKVKLGLKESLSSETLVTSITTPGGILMDENVFVVDMPGFDGEYANIDDPVYDTIAQRADLIVFVQSSNSAISKVSKQFLNKLADNNQEVPVCLIHNVFDSAYWRSIEERDNATEEQKDFAIDEIKRQGFNIDNKQCFKINLGKVEDSRNPAYSENEDLKSERKKYEGIENELYERVINRRDSMRLKVCLSRTRQQIDKTIKSIDEELKRREQLLERYGIVTNSFNGIHGTLNFQSVPTVNVNYESLKQIILNERDSTIAMIGTDNNHKSDTDAKLIVMNFVSECEKSVYASFGKTLSLDQIEGSLYDTCKKYISDIKAVSADCGRKPEDIEVERLQINGIDSIPLLSGSDLDLLVPHKFRADVFGIKQYLGHSAEDIVGYIKLTTDRLIGESDNNKGNIGKEGGPIQTLVEQVNRKTDDLKKKYQKICENYWGKSLYMVLRSIIPDKTAFDVETEKLKSLKQELIETQEKI